MRKNPEKLRGFTLIEVMISLIVFMVSLLGLVALQRASIAGTSKGREHTAAVNLGRFVLNWVQSEAATFPISQTTPNSTDFPLIENAISSGNLDSWQLLPNSATMRFDAYMGNNAQSHYTGGVDAAQFCVYYKMSQFVKGQDSSGDDQFVNEVYKLSVMVNWPKWKQYHTNWTNCAARPPVGGSGEGANLIYWESIELTSVVTREYTSKMQQ